MARAIEQAAAIPVYDGRVCLVTSRTGRRWVIPKGRIDPGHTAAEAARIEAWEEAGLLGVLVVLGGFAALCFAGLRIAGRARQPFALLAASACTALIVVPAICNAAVVMGLVPTKGLTLPFLSHGTNSLLCSALAVGILLRAGRDANGAPAKSVAWTKRFARA